MPYSPISSIKRLARAGVLAVAVGAAVSSAAAAADGAAAPPSFVQQALPAAALLGHGQMRFLGLRIYDARLWVGPQFKAADFGDYPLALELSYHRAFKGAAIAQRSIDEIERQGELTPAQAQRWLVFFIQAYPLSLSTKKEPGLKRAFVNPAAACWLRMHRKH